MTPILNQQDGKSCHRRGMQLSGTRSKIINIPALGGSSPMSLTRPIRTLGLLFFSAHLKIKSIGSRIKSLKFRATVNQAANTSGPLGIIMMLWYKLKLEGLRGGLSAHYPDHLQLSHDANPLPLPVLDGGHIVYALLELHSKTASCQHYRRPQ